MRISVLSFTALLLGSAFATSAADRDGDGVDNANDNCTLTFNVRQVDTDDDGTGNLCDDTLLDGSRSERPGGSG